MKPLNPLFLKIDELLLAHPDHYYTYQEILEAYTGNRFENTPRKTDTVKGHACYNSLKDSMKLVKKILQQQGLSLDYCNGKDASDGFRYPGGVEDPMRDKKTDHRQMRTEQLNRLVKASAGLFPNSWLADLLAGAQSMTDNDKIIIFDQNLHLEHIRWVPTIFDAIEKKLVLQFDYRAGYTATPITVLYHPYYLKEYNQRWFVFGRATDMSGKPVQFNTCAIDRIEGEILIREDIAYIRSKSKDFAKSYFKDIVGVTRKNGQAITIEIATLDAYTHGRIMTKPIHGPSQCEVQPFSTETGQGIISIRVIPNDELDSLLMSYGSGIRVMQPERYRIHFVEKVSALYNIYNNE